MAKPLVLPHMYRVLAALFIMLAGLFAPDSRLHATCAALIKGEIAYDVESCGLINPERTFDTRIERFAFIKDLPPENKKQFYNSYRGLILRGRVVRSLAVRSGLSSEPGALNGEIVSVFVPPGPIQCHQIRGKRLKAMLDEACCIGGGDVPCLLNSSYVLKNIQVIGTKGSAAGHKVQMELEKDPQYQRALVEFRQNKFASAVSKLEEFRKSGRLDPRGYYFLALAYRNMDRCPMALTVLEPLEKQFQEGRFWAQNEQYIYNGVLLKARCLSLMGRAGEAVIILQAFSQDPIKYKEQFEASLSHRDFNRIRTTKEYTKFREAALKARSAR